MTHLRVHSSVSEIPDREFTGFRHGCKALVHVQLPETLKRIGEEAFYMCRQLKYVHFVSNAHSLDTSSNPDLEDGTIAFPETLLQIESKAFFYCKRLQKVIVRSASTELGERVFLGCVGLISAELPEGLDMEDFVPDHDREDDEDSSMTSDSDDDSDNHEDGSIASFVRSD